jgi:hypothetical protein
MTVVTAILTIIMATFGVPTAAMCIAGSAVQRRGRY